MLPMIPTMMIIWGFFVLCFLSLIAYRATVTRYEDDQLFLSETEESVNSIEHREQDEIFRKVSRLAPFINVFGGAAALMTLAIIGFYVWDAIQKLR